MRTLIITGGPNKNPSIKAIADTCDQIICADSGADFAFSNNIRIDKIVGDLDSASFEAKELIRKNNIPVDVFPPEKDMTDTELALRMIEDKSTEIVLACSLAGRIDHVMANMNLILLLHKEGYDITATDGMTDVIPMVGKESITLRGIESPEYCAISIVLNHGDVKGVTTEGLYYELNNADLKYGSSLTISNKLKEGADSFSIHIEEGDALIVIADSRD